MLKYRIFILCFFGMAASAQQSSNFGVEFTTGLGSVVPHRENLGYLGRSFYPNIELALTFAPNPEKDWVKRHGNPQLGLTYHHSYYTDTLLGQAHAIYPWYRNRLFSLRGKHRLYYRVGFGFGYLTRTFANNEANTVISRPINVAFDGRVEYAYRISGNREIGVNYGFYHFSNAATRKPNYGLNHQMLMLRYATGFLPDFNKRQRIPHESKAYEWLLLGNFATRQNRPNDPTDLIGNVNIEFNLRVKGSFRYGIGFSVFYQAFEKQYDRFVNEFGDPNRFDHPGYNWDELLTYGTYLNSEWIFDRLSAVFQFGVLLNRSYATLEAYHDYGKGLHTHYMNMNRSLFFHRIGFRYRANDHILLNVTLKTYFAQAVYPEFGLGFRL